jgi:hypothetical protein
MALHAGRDPYNSARDGETSGRPADKEQTLPASPTIAIDREAREQALKALGGLTTDLNALDQHLAYLAGFFGEDNKLAAAVVGAVGISAGEMRQQIKPLRQAILNLPLMDEAGESS